ncbi:Kinesin heavy chain [Durusdinium trenchii]|uniref:Kinesin-like protein n=1 Tax=Durusdinium trenchii TaxID=1381693 RepID=A0ABP0NPJ7_9DINO
MYDFRTGLQMVSDLAKASMVPSLRMGKLEAFVEDKATRRNSLVERDPRRLPAVSPVKCERGDVLYLPTVTETPVSSVQEALEVMRTGNQNRHQAETKMNRHSSRSHAVFIVTVTNRVDQAKQRFAQLYLVDLAGSERVMKTGVQGMQLEEAKNINKSLLALGQVIWALAHKQKHIPYRDSKLTQLLRNCLGGNARTAVMITASMHPENAGESLSALRFGARASLVQNLARQNVAENAQELKRLLDEARQDLAELRSCCRRLHAELTASRCAESWLADGTQSDSNSKRLVVWGLLPSLVCPINRAIMRDPVLAADGWTYERRALEKHMTRGHGLPKSPVTGERFSSRQVTLKPEGVAMDVLQVSHAMPCDRNMMKYVIKELRRMHWEGPI